LLIAAHFSGRRLARTDDPDPFVLLCVRHDDQSVAVGSSDQDVSSFVLRMIGSGIVNDSGSPKAVIASTNDTPCLPTLAARLLAIPFKPQA
jgi:hypothetical protein